MVNKIKLVASDLDGTLLYPKRFFTLLTNQNKKFLQYFADNGGKVCCVTGRNPKMKHELEKKIKHKISFIGCNGAFIIDENDEVVIEHKVNNEDMLRVYNDLKDKKDYAGWMLYSLEDRMYCTSKMNKLVEIALPLLAAMRFKLSEKLTINEKKFLKHLKEDANYKLMAVFGMGKKKNRIAYDECALINETYGDILTAHYSNSSIEITAKGISKGRILEEYIETIGITKEEVVVVGDSGNDVSMFDTFPHSFCMDTAETYVKEHARHIISRVSDIESISKDEKLMEEDIIYFNEKLNNKKANN